MKKCTLLIISIWFMNAITAQSSTVQKMFSNDSIINRKDSVMILPDFFDINDSYDSIQFTGKKIMGIASFYSYNLDGTLTSTGERYRNNKLTGASNNLKLNTWVRVTNMKNCKTVIVRINDRMHPRMKKKGRVIDLSRLAAKKLDFMVDGLTKVMLEVILPPQKL